MSVSARNLLAGNVSAVKKGAINAEVVLALQGGDQLIAVITNESVENLGLKAGVEAFAMIKAPLVILTKGAQGLKFSTRNVLEGKVQKITHGAVNAEVSIKLKGKTPLTSIITEGSVKGMALQEGDVVNALFKASSVILAVRA
jgi:molybdate transport system regulatory protein